MRLLPYTLGTIYDPVVTCHAFVTSCIYKRWVRSEVAWDQLEIFQPREDYSDTGLQTVGLQNDSGVTIFQGLRVLENLLRSSSDLIVAHTIQCTSFALRTETINSAPRGCLPDVTNRPSSLPTHHPSPPNLDRDLFTF
jgi:hypothetical protein